MCSPLVSQYLSFSIVVLTYPGVYVLNAAEQAIRELEVYKTPLLPTRLQGSNTVPDMFKRKSAHAPVLMQDRERRPRLGSAERASGAYFVTAENQCDGSRGEQSNTSCSGYMCAIDSPISAAL